MTQDDIDNNKCCKYVHYTTALTAGVTCILQGNSARDTRHWSLTKQNDCIISVLWTHIMYLYLFGTAHKLHYRDINGAGAWWLVVYASHFIRRPGTPSWYKQGIIFLWVGHLQAKAKGTKAIASILN